MAKVILINGSPRADQCTATALKEMIKVFDKEGVETELIHVGNKDIRGCAACGYCSTHDGCVFGDRKSTRLNSSHRIASRMPSSA